MSSPTLHEKQSLGFFDVDLGIGLLDYGDGGMEEYDVVRGNEASTNKAVELTALDMSMPRNWIHACYVFENTGNHKDFMSPEKLKASLAKALDFVPAFSGRLQSDDGSSGLNFMKPKAPTRILLNNEGAWFTSTSMKTPFSDMKDNYFSTALVPSKFIFKSFTEAARQCRDHQVDAPLLAVKAVYFDCGSVSLAIYTSHQVTDGQGMYEFVCMWGRIARGVDPQPLIESRHVIGDIPKLEAKEAGEAQERFLKQEPFKPLMTEMQLCKLTVSNSQLKKLKQEINVKIAPDYISSDDLFYCVHMRMVLRARKEKNSIFYARLVSIRHFLNLDGFAFGNFVNMLLEGPIESSNLVDEPLEKVALELRKRVMAYNREKASKVNREYASVETHAIPDQLNNYDCSRDIGCTSITSYDPTRVDFHDSPALMLLACYYISGTLTINHILNGEFNGTVPIPVDIIAEYKDDKEAQELGFSVTPMKKLLFN